MQASSTERDHDRRIKLPCNAGCKFSVGWQSTSRLHTIQQSGCGRFHSSLTEMYIYVCRESDVSFYVGTKVLKPHHHSDLQCQGGEDPNKHMEAVSSSTHNTIFATQQTWHTTMHTNLCVLLDAHTLHARLVPISKLVCCALMSG